MRVKLAASVLRWAVDRAGGYAALGQKFPRLNQWLAQAEQPTLKQLERLARTTLVPLGYFFLDAPPAEELPIPHYRTGPHATATRPSAELLEMVYSMQQRQAWMRDYLIDQGNEKLSYVGSIQENQPAIQVARQIRTEMGLPEGWASDQPTWSDAFRFLIDRAEETGILVVVNGVVHNDTRRKLRVDEFRGFVLVDEYAPLVFINGSDAKAAQMFTLAHELVHVWFGKSAAFDLRRLQPADNPLERACDRAAAEFLVPEQSLRDYWKSVARLPTRFEHIARAYKVSRIVAARRALDLQLIEKKEFVDFYDDCMRSPQRQQASGGNFYATQNMRIGRRFAKAVAQALADGQLLYREAYQLTGLHGRTFDRFFASLSAAGAA